jgi:hypothetical protein
LTQVLQAGLEVSPGSTEQRSTGTGALSSGTQGAGGVGPVSAASLEDPHPPHKEETAAQVASAQAQSEDERCFMRSTLVHLTALD